MKQKNFFLFLLIFLLATAVAYAEGGESSSYSFDDSEGAIASSEGESSSYSFVSIIPYNQPIEAYASSNSYVFSFSYSSEEEDDDAPYTGSSGGGGGGGRKTSSVNFNVSPETLKYFLKTGQEKEKTISIENKGNESIEVEIKESAGYIGVDSRYITVPPYSVKQITILVNSRNENPGIYSSIITLSAGGVEKKVTLLIEIEDASSSLDVIVDVSEEDKVVVNPKNISASLVIYDLGGSSKMDVLIDYYIQDINGNIILHDSEQRKLNSGENIGKVVSLGEGLPVGDYVLSVKATYNGETAFSGSIFRIAESEELEEDNIYEDIVKSMGQSMIFIYIALGVVAVFLLFFCYYQNRIIIMILWTRHLVKNNDIYHAKKMYNKIASDFAGIKFEGRRKDRIKRMIKSLYSDINKNS